LTDLKIVLTVTNDLSFDQRMHRICGALANHGHEVTLVGRALPHSTPLPERSFAQKRLRCHFLKGPLFYAEYNLRLFLFLMSAPCDTVCSVDLDTLAAGFAATLLRRKKRVFDAHEYFTEVPEVINRPFVKLVWRLVARICLPFYRRAFTVGPALAEIMSKRYGIPFGVVRNVPHRRPEAVEGARSAWSGAPKVILYQGALNEGRGIEAMLEAMRALEGCELWLAGEGDLSWQLRQRAVELGLGERVRFWGYVQPDALAEMTRQAWLGINLLENRGLSYYYSLANKYFDYVQAGVPVLTMRFPEYLALQTQFEVAILLDDLDPVNIAHSIQRLIEQPETCEHLRHNCLNAREHWVWENEVGRLLGYFE
jgi:glycosyltransferase involved in cell wall biosynthesis